MAQPYQLVIDLGTCHTVAVVRRAGQAPRPLLFDGSPLLPSGVYRDPDGRLSVGRDAERLSMLNPSRYEPYPKRCVDDGTVLLGDAPVPVVELLAALLRRVLAEAAPDDGTPREVTLTCPADWGPQRREVLRAAARCAGLPEVRLVDEPVAAATYCAEVLGQPIPVGHGLLVFDFGGGTLDVTVVRRDPDGLRVLAVGGLDDLGGVDVDAALVGHLGQLVALRQPQVWRRLVDPHSTGEQRDRRTFWNEVRAAKEMLSRAPSAPIQIPGSEDALHLTREELERVAGPLVDRAVDETRRVLDRAGLAPGAGGSGTLAGILLVGGSSRIPLAASRLHARFGVAPTVPEQPELPVAYGGLLVAPPPGAPPRRVPPPPAPVSGEVPVSSTAEPVSASPYRISPVSGTVWAPEAPPGRQPAWAPAPAPPTAPGWTPPPAPPPARAGRRSLAIPVVAAVVVVVIVVILAWGGVTLFRSGGGLLGALGASPTGGTGTGGGSGGSGGPLNVVGAPIDLPADGAVAVTAAASGVYYSTTSSGKTTVHALEAATGKEKWKQDVKVEPSEVRLHVVGDLLLLDGKKSATDDGKDVRVVIQVADGHPVRTMDWTQKSDVAYLGTDVIVVTTSKPYPTQRVNLRTGQTAWTTPTGGFISHHPVKPELTWAAGPTNLPVPLDTVSESFGVNPDRVVQLDADAGKAQVVNGVGKVTASGKVTIDDDLLDDVWTSFDGLLLGAMTSEAANGKAQLAAYHLSDLKQAWNPVAFGAGDEIKHVHPCGDHLVCVAYKKNATDTEAVVAVDTRNGTRLDWSGMPKEQFGDSSTELYWLVLAGATVYGESAFPPQLGCEKTGIEVVAPNTGAATQVLAAPGRFGSYVVIGGAGRYLAVRTVGVRGGSTVWQVSLQDLTTGKRSGTLDVGGGDKLPQEASTAGNVLAVIGADRKLYVATAPNLAS
jgi:molecular chaperone HscA